MPLQRCTVKHGKNKHKIKFAKGNPPTLEEFQAQVFSLTSVPPERQTLLCKGAKILSQEDFAKLKNKSTIMLMGSAAAVAVERPTEAVVFKEDMTKEERAKLDTTLPCGLENLGNTCYLNSTVQCLRALPELTSLAKNYAVENANSQNQTSSHQITKAYGDMLIKMDATEDAYTPNGFVDRWRQLHPRFAERDPKHGGYMQHDSEEFNTLLLTDIKNSTGSKIDELFTGELTSTMECAESKEEPPKESKEPFTKLQCFIDENTTHLATGMKNKMTEVIEKNAPSLGRNAQWKQESRISGLPKYMTVQVMRFFWKQKVQKSAKIKKAVVFPQKLDIYELCAPELKSKIGAYRRKKLGLEDDKKEEKKDDNAMSVDEPTAPAASANSGKEEAKEEKMDVDAPATKKDIITLALDNMQMDPEAREMIEAAARENFEEAALVQDVVEAWAMTTFGLSKKADIADEKKEEVSNEITGYYRLRGVVTHKGLSAQSGHYIGYVLDPKKGWIQFDDEYSTEVHAEHVKQLYGGTGHTQMSYVCYYERLAAGEEDKIQNM